jgi:hypothetical protein
LHHELLLTHFSVFRRVQVGRADRMKLQSFSAAGSRSREAETQPQSPAEKHASNKDE